MATRQSQIREYFHDQIVAVTGLPDASVKRSPRYKIDSTDLPVIAIYTHDDKPVDSEQISDRPHDRFYTVAVEINVPGRDEEDITEPLAVAVRKAILTDGTLGGLAHFTSWASQQWAAKENQTAECASLLLFSCQYTWRPDW